ncbi:hypothetical protein CK203_038027 [Vitis vinifera]|uniref:Uncharacterized protein n=1 Tax=Vitis vinifera TaxID=29760 RepID=A0A438HNY8_VITVI|nr:hypothetical protein CK203_038027 [Vitis vinifera]
MAALLYFEEKVHRKKLLRADAIPLLFPDLPSTEPIPEVAPSAPHATPRLPCYSTISEPSPSSEPRIAISISSIEAYVTLCRHCHFSEHPHSADDSSSCSSGADYRHSDQHTAILRQIQHHLGILSLLSTHSYPSEPQSHHRPLLRRADYAPEEPTTGEQSIHQHSPQLSHHLHIILPTI